MKFYLIESDDYKYLSFSHVGTWTKGKLCEGCGQPSSKLVSPLIIEWDKGENDIGDFSWCGYTCIVKENVFELFFNENIDCEFGDVIDETKGKYRNNIKFDNILKWILPAVKVPINLVKSNVELIVDCEVCNQRKFKFKREGLFIDKNKWDGSMIFYIEQFTRSDAVFVTEEFLDIIEKNSFSNIKFSLAGIIE